MNSLFFSFIILLFLSPLFPKATHLKRLTQTTCNPPALLRNRATGYYLGVGAIFETLGFEAVLDYKYSKWCVDSGIITNIDKNLVIDVWQQDINNINIVLWSKHGSNNADQFWNVVYNENTGFWSFLSVIQNKNLALAAVDQYDHSKGLTIKTQDGNDPAQQWSIVYN